MDRVSAANYITVGGKRQFQDINPGAGVLNGTELAAEWHNGAQESICLAQEASGQVSTDADNMLLTKSILAFGAGSVTNVTASGALTALEAGTVLLNAAGGNVAITLPAANGLGGYPIRFRLVRTDTSGNTVNVTPAAGNVLGYGGTPPANFSVAVGEMIEIASDGNNTWVCVDDSMKGQRRYVITAGSGTWVVPFTASSVVLRAFGGGGGGGGSASGNAGGGGGGGGFCEVQEAVQPGQVFSYAIGAAGTGGTTGNPGTAGTATTIGPLTAGGGNPGTSTAGSYGGGSGGVATGGVLNLDGGEGNGGGAPGIPRGGACPRGGDGGAASNGLPTAGMYPGGGGGGYGTGGASTGAPGAAGMVEIIY